LELLLLIPSRLEFGANDLDDAWSCLRCCKILVVAALKARDRVASAGRADARLLLSMGPFKAMRDATSNAILPGCENGE
jgi:hypothetical protein